VPICPAICCRRDLDVCNILAGRSVPYSRAYPSFQCYAHDNWPSSYGTIFNPSRIAFHMTNFDQGFTKANASRLVGAFLVTMGANSNIPCAMAYQVSKKSINLSPASSLTKEPGEQYPWSMEACCLERYICRTRCFRRNDRVSCLPIPRRTNISPGYSNLYWSL
jgi:hypothetical protein